MINVLINIREFWINVNFNKNFQWLFIFRYKLEPDDDFNSDVLEDFVEKFKAGKLKPHWKSQAIPKKQKGPVRVVVADSFEKEVMYCFSLLRNLYFSLIYIHF